MNSKLKTENPQILLHFTPSSLNLGRIPNSLTLAGHWITAQVRDKSEMSTRLLENALGPFRPRSEIKVNGAAALVFTFDFTA